MIQNFLFKLLLSPFSLLYGIGVSLRNFFYRSGILKETQFNIPVVSIGNLSIGGAGKTPHIEYLIYLLRDYLEIATLSRGYKRKTRGFLTVKYHDDAEQVGDEPLQYKRKFPDIFVAVGEDRTFAIPKILGQKQNTQLILLDDAFQHRAVKPDLNILLTEYDRPFTGDFLLPSGRLREWRSSYKRADVIIVSKCPKKISIEDKEHFLSTIKPFAYQKVFFTYYKYLHPYYIFNRQYKIQLDDTVDIILTSGIAKTDYLLSYLQEKVNSVSTLEYEDHHYFSKFDISHIKASFERLDSERKIIITTEKDAMRLELHKNYLIKNKLPIFVLPVVVDFHFNEGEKFNNHIKKTLLDYKA